MRLENTAQTDDTYWHRQALAENGLNVGWHGAMKMMMQISMCK